MKKAKFEFEGWTGKIVQEFSGETWADVLNKFSQYQDIDCLLRQARMMGTPEDVESLEALEACLEKCWRGDAVKEDFENFRSTISIGGFRRVSCEDETGAVCFAHE